MARIMRYGLTDDEWTAIKPMLPNKPRGVPRVNDRRVLNGIFWVLRSGVHRFRFSWTTLPLVSSLQNAAQESISLRRFSSASPRR